MGDLKLTYHNGGVFLPGLGLWLDPRDAVGGPERVMVSHAHSDHVGLHREVILTEATGRLMKARLRGDWIEHVLPFGRACEFQGDGGRWRLTLLPAGHILGSAMAWIEAGGTSLLYTGDFKLRPGLSSEPCDVRRADILVMETTFGRPHYRFPPVAEVMRGVVRFCQEALDNDETPVLLGYSLGKCQEVLTHLAAAGLPISLHSAAWKLTKIYEELGKSFPPHEKLEEEASRGRVLICPPGVARSETLRSLGKTRVAMLTGWAMDPGCRFQHQAHAAFPLSDHADFDELVEMVKRVGPKQVYTLHGFASDFAQTLRDMGFNAQALSEEDQLSLGLVFQQAAAAPPAISESAPSPPPVEADPELPAGRAFETFAKTCAAIAGTTRKLEKTRLLAEYLRQLEGPALGWVAVWFTGNPFPPSQGKALQLGWSLLRETLCQLGGMGHAEFGQVYLKHSDLGETAAEITERMALPSRPLVALEAVDELFHQLQAARGPAAKSGPLLEVLRRCGPLEAKYLVKILTGDLRIGLKEGLVEESIALAFGVGLEGVKHANLLVGHIGEAALLASRGQLDSVALIPFRPAKYMLASPEQTALDVWRRALEWNGLPAEPVERSLPIADLPQPAIEVWIEDKYDGIRAQIHKVGEMVSIFSRDLKDITQSFEELASAARGLAGDVILDGEIVAMRGGVALPYAELQKRLGRREGDLFLNEQIPVRFVAFDLLWLNQKGMLDAPLRERRAALEGLALEPLLLAQVTPARSAADIDGAFDAAKGRGNEGLVIKDPSSAYTPGRRGLAWLKLKKACATLDCVVVGAEYGHGRRKSVLSDYTFAVRDSQTGELKVIGKAYSGLTDQEIADLTRHLLSRVEWQKGRYHAVRPEIVMEIAFDLIQPSRRHSSGFALRFPRIVRLRPDKKPAEVDTVEAARAIWEAASGTAKGKNLDRAAEV